MRRSLLFTLLLSVFFISAKSQITKGSILLGGDLRAGTTKNKFVGTPSEGKRNELYFSPVFGRAIKENLVVGVNISLGLINQKNEDGSVFAKNTTNMYGAGVFVRRYKQLSKSDFYLFGQLGLNGYVSRSKYVSNVSTELRQTDGLFIDVNLSPGVVYAVSKRFHLECSLPGLASIGYQHNKTKTGDPLLTTTENSSFNIGTSLGNVQPGIALGFRFFLTK
jgi:hypothetical protein